MKTWVIAGLGNPGPQYLMTRHNIGFMAVDLVQEMSKATPFRKKSTFLISECSNFNQKNCKIILIKPQTYMNLSGQAIQSALSFYKISMENLIVIHDDLALLPGDIRIKQGGGNAGHNGLRSIDSTIGNQYWRFRLGIGHPGVRHDVSSYVLSSFSKNEIDEWLLPCLEQTVKKLDEFLDTH